MRRNNTLLAKLGFHDEDKKNSDHDHACNYLSERPVCMQLIQHFSPAVHDIESISNIILQIRPMLKACGLDEIQSRLTPDTSLPVVLSNIEFSDIKNEWQCLNISKEHPISKGSGQYKSTIGFMDVFVHYRHNISFSWYHKDNPKEVFQVEKVYKGNQKILFEVKTYLNVAEFLRQIKLYKGHVSANKYVLVLTNPISEYQKREVEKEGIQVIKLGEAFIEWKYQQIKSNKEADVVEF